jgi:diguanylate cyclase (GGDEF)-like protein
MERCADRKNFTGKRTGYGGEELVVLCPETNIYGAVALGEKIRRSVEQHVYPLVGKITISVGAAEFSGEDCAASLIKHADEALYTAKRLGRNRVETQTSWYNRQKPLAECRRVEPNKAYG